MAHTILHLRSEDKPQEHRSALTPTTAKALIDAGYTVNVEKSPVRIFDDAEFEKIGATLVPTGSWRDVPADHIIVGLKELPEEAFPLKHVHVSFAHCFKNQGGWETVLARFPRGGGTLLDLEFLNDPVSGRRVAAFGYSAGFSGSALALKNWAWQLTHPGEPLPSVESYPNEDTLVDDIKKELAEGQKKAGRLPRVIVIGALGRCGRGAVDMALKAGVPENQILKWDMAETAAGGPFKEIVESDIFINCIYLTSKIQPFVDVDSLKTPGRQLSVVCDVSADTTNPNNPVPIYTIATTFKKPTVPVDGLEGAPLSVISIDHLPSLLPRESSEAFSGDLLPYLLKLNDWQNDPVWAGAKKLFDEKVATLPKEALNP
ncbi:hypothetical protein JX265_008139 [Neoarthrinium moseri]|uniref:Saccharopine dehydrogenase [NAD(+), L-lysine-forming] n=1 Tax=Neoarthrinium moseri TaxID=1658444 RepID=A0A9P9WI95_9PEZI|nr:uncharacterized protein JN550_004836 [Neoarthrinium moseri]KAI1852056.1 hypothetical protein JX266_002909 [Neoarthrinium moseri]KAI1865092.1 hypothetical protein JX265_008139 [Neoarthrinium moseri]KAI1870690.1 hypothetical protein JN550_004836 [Neoarthrinium moseri]